MVTVVRLFGVSSDGPPTVLGSLPSNKVGFFRLFESKLVTWPGQILFGRLIILRYSAIYCRCRYSNESGDMFFRSYDCSQVL